jgi:hypothetical protein
VFQGVGGDLIDRYHDIVSVRIAQTTGGAPSAQPPTECWKIVGRVEVHI